VIRKAKHLLQILIKFTVHYAGNYTNNLAVHVNTSNVSSDSLLNVADQLQVLQVPTFDQTINQTADPSGRAV